MIGVERFGVQAFYYVQKHSENFQVRTDLGGTSRVKMGTWWWYMMLAGREFVQVFGASRILMVMVYDGLFGQVFWGGMCVYNVVLCHVTPRSYAQILQVKMQQSTI